MIASMTAYACTTTQWEGGRAVWELRSVNNRYLDVVFKIPDAFRAWERDWRALAANYLNRGKLECYLTFVPSTQPPAVVLNQPLMHQLLASCKTLAENAGMQTTLELGNLLRWPDLLMTASPIQMALEEGPDSAALKASLSTQFSQALAQLVETRHREGEQLLGGLQEKLAKMQEHLKAIQVRQPMSLRGQKQKLENRLNELTVKGDLERLEQEWVYYAQRLDIQEEIDRLNAHLQEVAHTLAGIGPAGRRLDFLMQELNREANTLGAKSGDTEISQSSLEIKLLIEQMREQIQNVE